MKSLIFSFLFATLLVLIIIAANVNIYHVHAPELFGDSRLFYLETKGRLIGIIHDSYATYMITGTVDGTFVSCKMTYFGGTYIGGSENGVPCQMQFKNSHFRGWIDFRGHLRKFCGAIQHENLPCR